MEREPFDEDSPDRLAGDESPARRSEAARHEDDLSPAKDLRERLEPKREGRRRNRRRRPDHVAPRAVGAIEESGSVGESGAPSRRAGWQLRRTSRRLIDSTIPCRSSS